MKDKNSLFDLINKIKAVDNQAINKAQIGKKMSYCSGC